MTLPSFRLLDSSDLHSSSTCYVLILFPCSRRVVSSIPMTCSSWHDGEDTQRCRFSEPGAGGPHAPSSHPQPSHPCQTQCWAESGLRGRSGAHHEARDGGQGLPGHQETLPLSPRQGHRGAEWSDCTWQGGHHRKLSRARGKQGPSQKRGLERKWQRVGRGALGRTPETGGVIQAQFCL